MSQEEENKEPEVNEEETVTEPEVNEEEEEEEDRSEGYYCKGNISCDGKSYKKGDKYEGEHAERLLKSGALERV